MQQDAFERAVRHIPKPDLDRLVDQLTPLAKCPPYIFNLVPFIEEPGIIRAAFVLRWSLHAAFDSPNFDKTDASRYHGGGMIDEIAALVRHGNGAELGWRGRQPLPTITSCGASALPGEDIEIAHHPQQRLVLPRAYPDSTVRT
jgi:hypothetical protein